MATPTGRWANATRRKLGLRALSSEQAHGWGVATRKKRGLGPVAETPSPHKQRLRRTKAKATQATRGVARQQRLTRQATRKAKGVRRAQTSRASGLAGGRRGGRRRRR